MAQVRTTLLYRLTGLILLKRIQQGLPFTLQNAGLTFCRARGSHHCSLYPSIGPLIS